MRTLSTLVPLSLVFSVTAQPTFQYANLPTSTAYFTNYMVTDPGTAGVPSGGADQTWDFSSVQFAEVGGALLGPAAGTPYASSYPAANYAMASWATGSTDMDYSYLVANTTALEAVVEHVPAAPNVFTDYLRYIQFSTTYGNGFTDTYDSPADQGSVTWTYTGYGTLITSLGTFTDQILMQNTDGDMFIWNPDPLFPRFIANSDNPILLLPDLSGIQAKDGPGLTVRVFPDPAQDHITVEGPAGSTRWTVHDLLGRELLHGTWTAGNLHTIDIASLAHGQYVLQVEGSDHWATARFERM
jgi:hypothetical protein